MGYILYDNDKPLYLTNCIMKNNTPETFKLWKQLYELENAYNKDREVHNKPFGSAMRSLIQKLHHELMEYKDPREEWVALYR